VVEERLLLSHLTKLTQGFALLRSAQPWANLLRPVGPPERVDRM
jgi:hypothetical protein